MGRPGAQAFWICLVQVACGGAGTPAAPDGTGTSSPGGTSGATFFTGVATLGTGEGCTPTPTTSAGQSFGPECSDTSTSGGTDVAPPVVTITHPYADLVLNSAGSVHLTYTVEDESCIVSATLYIDGASPRELPVPPYDAVVQDLPWGTPELTLEVTDAAGNVGVSPPVGVRVCAGPKDPV